MATVEHHLEALDERSSPVGVRRKVSPVAAWSIACLAVDGAMLGLAEVAAWIGSAAADSAQSPPVLGLAFPVFVLGLFKLSGLYRWRANAQVLDSLRNVLAMTTLAAMAVSSLGVLLTRDVDVAVVALRLWAFASVYVGAGRFALHNWQMQARRRNDAVRPTLIVGAGRIGRLTAGRLLANPQLGFRPVGFLDKEPLPAPGNAENGLPVLGASWDLEQVVEEHGIQQVIVTFSTAPSEVLLGIARRCARLGVEVASVPRLFEAVTDRLVIEHIGGLPFVTSRRVNPAGWQFALKHALDRLGAATALVVTLPLLVGGALAVRLAMGTPIFFRQLRVGRDGRAFEMLKLRTMNVHPEADLREVGDDPRTGRVGRFLRQTSIDELPQLVNVLRGEMSLVGPRPERPELVERFEKYIYRYGDRHRVKAGVTGWSQVQGLGRGRDRFSQAALSDRVEWDNYYIENWSLWLDLKVLLMTVGAVVRSYRAG